MKHLAYACLLLGLLACAPSNTPLPSATPNALIGTWRGKDIADQSNITLTIAAVPNTSNRFEITGTDDATAAWCGTTATLSATATLENQALSANLLWKCTDASKPAQFYPTTISYNASDDTITAYDAPFRRVK